MVYLVQHSKNPLYYNHIIDSMGVTVSVRVRDIDVMDGRAQDMFGGQGFLEVPVG